MFLINRTALQLTKNIHHVRTRIVISLNQNQRMIVIPSYHNVVDRCVCTRQDIKFSWHIRGFHSSPRRNIHPALWVVLKPILNISAALTGRSVRKWYQRLDSKRKTNFWSTMMSSWPVWAGLGLSLVCAFGFYITSHIKETPITGRRRFIALTHNQLELISETEAKSINDNYASKMYKENDVQTVRVLNVMNRLIQCNPELQKMNFGQWQIYVIKDELINACVLPTGHVYVFEGMLKMANTQNQLAVVLGHEVAHALLEHGVEELSYAQLIDYVLIVFLAAIWCIIPSDGISFITQWFHKKVFNLFTHLPHSRSIEREADNVGTMLAARACFDVREGPVLWRKMEAVQKLNKEDLLPEWMSTHPDNEKRADHIDFLVPRAEKWRDEMKCPKWPNEDPRKVIEVMSKMVDNHVTAQKAGQDLRHIQQVATSKGRKEQTKWKG